METKFLIDDKSKPVVDFLQGLKAEWFKSILITGSVGVWKTYIAKNLFGGYFIDEPRFKQEMISGNMRLRNPDEWNCGIDKFPLEALSKMPQVIYDDYWAVAMSEAYIEKMLYWLNERKKRVDSEGKPFRTIFTTNLTVEQIKQREARLGSRILEDCVVVTMSGEDRRTKNVRIVNF